MRAPAGSPAQAGDRIDYVITVTNNGNVTLHGIAVNDLQLAAVTCAATDVAPGDSVSCTGTHTVTQAEVDSFLREESLLE